MVARLILSVVEKRRPLASGCDNQEGALAKLFISYSHSDEDLRAQLEKQLTTLKRQNVIEVWHDRKIGAGEEFAFEIDKHIESDDIILLLVSPDFISSEYCYAREMTRAMERHQSGVAIVIPVILRACEWQESDCFPDINRPTVRRVRFRRFGFSRAGAAVIDVSIAR